VLSPPYREDVGRKCSYYVDYPYPAFGNGDDKINGVENNYAWLAEVPTPDDLYMRPGIYNGPAIQPELIS
jgi:cysteamine dioxygenase